MSFEYILPASYHWLQCLQWVATSWSQENIYLSPLCLVVAVWVHCIYSPALDVNLAGNLSEGRRRIVTQINSNHTQRLHSESIQKLTQPSRYINDVLSSYSRAFHNSTTKRVAPVVRVCGQMTLLRTRQLPVLKNRISFQDNSPSCSSLEWELSERIFWKIYEHTKDSEGENI